VDNRRVRSGASLGPRGFALLRLIGGATIVLFVAVIFTPLASIVDGWLAQRPRLEAAAAIVVLGGGGVRADGTLSDISLRRTLHGIMLYQRGLAPLIVFSGSPVRGRPSESEVRAAVARSLGVPSTSILVQTAQTTREEGQNIARLLLGRGIRRILLVADAQGMRRAAKVFERVGFEPLPAPAADVSSSGGGPQGRLALARLILIELAALAYYAAAGYV
jgi:uncharacterized SAM-binding protein YcdF (DUF218 family)